MCISYFSVIEFLKRMIFQESWAGITPQRVAQIPKTTGTSRGWCSTSPSEEVQDRCREEIREVIGDNKCRVEDIKILPYTKVCF